MTCHHDMTLTVFSAAEPGKEAEESPNPNPNPTGQSPQRAHRLKELHLSCFLRPTLSEPPQHGIDCISLRHSSAVPLSVQMFDCNQILQARPPFGWCV